MCLAGIAFSFTPLKRGGPPGTPGTPSFTPGKVLLANGETRMNMLSPACDNTKLFHADVEYQKIVSEWTFQKDTVDIPQVCTGLGRWGMCFGGGGLGTALMYYNHNSGRNLSIQAASCWFAVQLQQVDPPETHGGHPTAVGHPAAAAVV
jgi:hypothetical protein